MNISDFDNDYIKQQFDDRSLNDSYELSAWGLDRKNDERSFRFNSYQLPLVDRNQKYVENKKNLSLKVCRNLKKDKWKRSPKLSFDLHEFSPSKVLTKEIKDWKKLPYFPKRDLKLFRRNIRCAAEKSRNVEELLKLTKIPTAELLKDFGTGMNPKISPLKKFDMNPFLRYGLYTITNR